MSCRPDLGHHERPEENPAILKYSGLTVDEGDDRASRQKVQGALGGCHIYAGDLTSKR